MSSADEATLNDSQVTTSVDHYTINTLNFDEKVTPLLITDEAKVT
jgi:hypothetical protein